MLCMSCGYPAETIHNKWNMCYECKTMLDNHFLIKCLTCGSYSFLPITTKSIFYMAGSNMIDNVALSNFCPNCVRWKDD